MTPVAKHKTKVVKRLQHHDRKRRLHVPPAVATDAVNVLSMTQPMVDRLFWRAGFGPTPADRAKWVGKPVADAVDWLLIDPRHAVRGLAGDERRRAARSVRQRHGSRAELGRRDGAFAEPARRAHDVLLAPPLRELAHGRLAAAAPDHAERALPQLRGSRHEARGRLQEPGLRRLDRSLDAALPDG